MNQKVERIDRKPARKKSSQAVQSNQKAIDALPLDSGAWRVVGVPGLYVRCRAETRSFYLVRRIDGKLAWRTLGELSMKDAKAKATEEWNRLKPAPAGGRKTLGQAFEEFIEDGGARGELSLKSRALNEYNWKRYLSRWKGHALEQIGEDRDACRLLYRNLTGHHGRATANQVFRLLRAVWNHARKVDRDLPESPTVAVTLAPIKPRDWALSPEALAKAWRDEQKGEDGKAIVRGISTLTTPKKMWWITAMLTGARAGSIEALEWHDVDLQRRILRFRTAKGGRAYAVPMSDKLVDLFSDYRKSDDVTPSRFVFPNRRNDDDHMVLVKNVKEGVPTAHHFRHTYRTILAQLGATPEQSKLLMGHALTGVSEGYITSALVLESLRPITNAVSERLAGILPDLNPSDEVAQ